MGRFSDINDIVDGTITPPDEQEEIDREKEIQKQKEKRKRKKNTTKKNEKSRR